LPGCGTASSEHELAYYYDFDDDFLLQKERFVQHFELYSA
jgi:hypothetical protein